MIALEHVGLLPQLSLLFQAVLVPKAVRTELFRRRAMKDRLQALLSEYAFLRLCDEYEQVAVDVMLIEQDREGGRDRGEAEAVVQAARVGAATGRAL